MSFKNQTNTERRIASGGRLACAVAIMGTAQLGAELNPQEVKLITAFLHSLTGKVPQVIYPVLPVETAATPKPTVEVVKP